MRSVLKAVHVRLRTDAPQKEVDASCEQTGSLALPKRGNWAHVEMTSVLLYATIYEKKKI